MKCTYLVGHENHVKQRYMYLFKDAKDNLKNKSATVKIIRSDEFVRDAIDNIESTPKNTNQIILFLEANLTNPGGHNITNSTREIASAYLEMSKSNSDAQHIIIFHSSTLEVLQAVEKEYNFFQKEEYPNLLVGTYFTEISSGWINHIFEGDGKDINCNYKDGVKFKNMLAGDANLLKNSLFTNSEKCDEITTHYRENNFI